MFFLSLNIRKSAHKENETCLFLDEVLKNAVVLVRRRVEEIAEFATFRKRVRGASGQLEEAVRCGDVGGRDKEKERSKLSFVLEVEESGKETGQAPFCPARKNC